MRMDEYVMFYCDDLFILKMDEKIQDKHLEIEISSLQK